MGNNQTTKKGSSQGTFPPAKKNGNKIHNKVRFQGGDAIFVEKQVRVRCKVLRGSDDDANFAELNRRSEWRKI